MSCSSKFIEITKALATSLERTKLHSDSHLINVSNLDQLEWHGINCTDKAYEDDRQDFTMRRKLIILLIS